MLLYSPHLKPTQNKKKKFLNKKEMKRKHCREPSVGASLSPQTHQGQRHSSTEQAEPVEGIFMFVCLFFCGTRASHCCGLSRCGAQATDAQAQRPWLTGRAAPRYVGSSRTGARTYVPCIGRRTLNHCATREAPYQTFYVRLQLYYISFLVNWKRKLCKLTSELILFHSWIYDQNVNILTI